MPGWMEQKASGGALPWVLWTMASCGGVPATAWPRVSTGVEELESLEVSGGRMVVSGRDRSASAPLRLSAL
jgi:hypothetical protein